MPEKHDNHGWRLCGHGNMVSFLQAAIDDSRIAHAYLFYGQAGLGKHKAAKEFAKALLCDGKAAAPCHGCASCSQVEHGSHFDYFELNRLADDKKGKMKKDITVEQVREISGKLRQGSLLGGRKVAIIREADALNANSANALLKTLEEPAANTVIILVSDDIAKLPKTIVSRCQKIKFLPVPARTIESYLKSLGAAADEAKLLSRISGGIAGKAIGFHFDREARERYFAGIRLFLGIASAPLGRRLSLVAEALPKDDQENSVQLLLAAFMSSARDLLLLANDNAAYASNLEALGQEAETANRLPLESIRRAIAGITAARSDISRNISPKNALENFAISF